MDAVNLVLIALATARITRLITSDRITQPLRTAIVRRLKDGSELAYLLMCDWCVSIYVGFGVTLAWWYFSNTAAFAVAAIALSASYITGWLASRTED